VNLSITELHEIQMLWETLNKLTRISVGEITIYDGTGLAVGKLVRDNEVWSFEYGEEDA
jgi:ornithine cyclodeaminase/alanine dehydrogenase-like protein (mu-crystallin family)